MIYARYCPRGSLIFEYSKFPKNSVSKVFQVFQCYTPAETKHYFASIS
jgi:hypothetical protein